MSGLSEKESICRNAPEVHAVQSEKESIRRKALEIRAGLSPAEREQ